jgi:hypothetical protein
LCERLKASKNKKTFLPLPLVTNQGLLNLNLSIKMKMNLLLVLVVILTACEGGNSHRLGIGSPEAAYEVDTRLATLDAPVTEQSAPSIIDRKLIRNGNIEFLTSDVRNTKTEIERIAKEQQGYISAENENNYGNRFQINQTLRIPADKFDEVLKQLEGLAEKVDNKNINTQDVTEEFIDVEARLKTKKELEARYLELLKQAKTVAVLFQLKARLPMCELRLNQWKAD